MINDDKDVEACLWIVVEGKGSDSGERWLIEIYSHQIPTRWVGGSDQDIVNIWRRENVMNCFFFQNHRLNH